MPQNECSSIIIAVSTDAKQKCDLYAWSHIYYIATLQKGHNLTVICLHIKNYNWCEGRKIVNYAGACHDSSVPTNRVG